MSFSFALDIYYNRFLAHVLGNTDESVVKTHNDLTVLNCHVSTENYNRSNTATTTSFIV